jgi:hypothetical protein
LEWARTEAGTLAEGRWRARLETVTVALERSCENCERTLGPSRADRKFCSTACRIAAHRARRVELGRPDVVEFPQRSPRKLLRAVVCSAARAEP